MNRRSFLRHSIAGGIVFVTVNRVAATEASPANPAPANPPVAEFELDELTVGELQAGMASGKFTANSLAKKYLDRIDEIDKHGPTIKSVIELNPEAPIASDLIKNERRKDRADHCMASPYSSKTISTRAIA
jgi:amidase